MTDDDKTNSCKINIDYRFNRMHLLKPYDTYVGNHCFRVSRS